MIGEGSRGRGARRGFRGQRFVPYSSRARRPRGVRIAEYHSPLNEDHEVGSDDSTQPPSHPWEPPCPISMPPPEPSRGPSPVREPPPNGDNIVPVVTPPNGDNIGPVVTPPNGDNIGTVCIAFEMLRKQGKVILKINDGETAPCCTNSSMFTARVTQIIKQHCDMSYARWTDVPQAQKDELIDGDFVLDWDRENHKLTVVKQLRKRFNAFHHQLHKKYESYGSHEEALASGCSLVDVNVWITLCRRWGSDEFKKMSRQNRENRKAQIINHTAGRKSFVRILEEKRAASADLVEFYKETHWSKKTGKFVTTATEASYKEMVKKLNGLEHKQRTNDVAASVFREVLGSRPGYARGLGEMIIPESTRQRDSQREKEYPALIKKHKQDADNYKKDAENYRKDADKYKTQLDAIQEEVLRLRERQNVTDVMMREFFQNFHTPTKSQQSHRETL
ncbi:hypothetical protein I3842_10G086200 [Carya illinoinensis]|uniref:Transposase n=1 Tax=Carya illinoinensis TaxID=32201 RepID=A0A922J4K2_CARIL|nr:hypothetical protein I3842_10G086200 [Carya illinoinensis]